MGAKVAAENKKLNVPGAGSYEIGSKVSKTSDFDHCQHLGLPTNRIDPLLVDC